MFAVKTNNYLEELIKSTCTDESQSPIAKQFRFDERELINSTGEKPDYLGEDNLSYCGGFITQKYPNRILVYASETCAALCRHCTRKRKVQRTNAFIVEDKLNFLHDYIVRNNIIDVLISGGDPFMLHKEIVFSIVNVINKAFSDMNIQGVIRIGTRVPCTNPSIILDNWSDNDLKRLSYSGVQYINVQFNCAEELSPLAKMCLSMIKNNGISLNNQSVLLKGVNDSTESLVNLNVELYKSGVRPYYLYSCDLVPGLSHFRVSIKRGIQIYEKMRGIISGLANPLFIVDLPDGMGKTPVNPFYMKQLEEGQYLFTNYCGRQFLYHDKDVTVDEY